MLGWTLKQERARARCVCTHAYISRSKKAKKKDPARSRHRVEPPQNRPQRGQRALVLVLRFSRAEPSGEVGAPQHCTSSTSSRVVNRLELRGGCERGRSAGAAATVAARALRIVARASEWRACLALRRRVALTLERGGLLRAAMIADAAAALELSRVASARGGASLRSRARRRAPPAGSSQAEASGRAPRGLRRRPGEGRVAAGLRRGAERRSVWRAPSAAG